MFCYIFSLETAFQEIVVQHDSDVMLPVEAVYRNTKNDVNSKRYGKKGSIHIRHLACSPFVICLKKSSLHSAVTVGSLMNGRTSSLAFI